MNPNHGIHAKAGRVSPKKQQSRRVVKQAFTFENQCQSSGAPYSLNNARTATGSVEEIMAPNSNKPASALQNGKLENIKPSYPNK